MKPEIKVSENCIHCGLCASIYPDVFEIAPDGHVVIKDIDNIDIERLKEVAASCPIQGISIYIKKIVEASNLPEVKDTKQEKV